MAKRVRALPMATLVVVAVAAALVATPTFAGDKNHGSGSVKPCGDNGEITYTPAVLWPANHKDVTITFTYSDPDGDMVMLDITANPHNEIVDGEEINGTGNTPAATDSVGGMNAASGGSVTVEGSARAERSGHKNDDGGRVYEFDYVAESDDMDGCMSETTVAGDGILIFVPHDCRGGGCKP